MQPGGDLENA
jgi:hypothetical protein